METEILGYEVKIKNIVSSFNLKGCVDLGQFHKYFPESIFSEAKFNYGVVILRILEPKMSFLIYRTGKIISTGANSIDASMKAPDIFLDISREKGLHYSILSRDGIQNIVGVLEMKNPIDLWTFSHKAVNVVYEPEQFPGAIVSLNLRDINAKFLVFSSGRIVIVGAKSMREIENGIDRFLRIYERTWKK